MTLASVTPPEVAQGQRFILPNNSGRLRYANAEDLPSYPSAGLKEGSTAASAAATLGWAKKPVEPWRPDTKTSSASASAAALLAADYKSPTKDRGVQPISAAGSQAALAASSIRKHQKSPSTPPSLWGSSAANLAFKGTKPPPAPPASPPSTETATLARQNSMRAAQGAMTGIRRPRASSSPQVVQTYPDQANAAANALSAATLAHRPARSEVGAVPYTTMSRSMFTSKPPVKPEIDEKERADVLHASAVVMARKMYNQQQKMIDSAKEHRRSSSFPRHGTARPTNPGHEEKSPMMYGNLQEAAYRLAQERLAKIHTEHDQNLADYYGTLNRSKTGSIRGKLTRRRSSSDGDLLEDQRRSQHIRKQMSMLNTKLTEVDEEKRTKDRQALLAAAQRNVKAQLHDMDKKLQAETGRVPLSTMSDWERKARVAAQTRFDATNIQTSQKVDIGGGKFLDQAEIDQIAARKVQPLLDEINERAEREAERREKERLDEEKRKEDAERERLRRQEIQEIYQRLREDEKAREAEIKHEAKLQKQEAKAIKAQQKRAEKEEKQKDREATAVTTGETAETQDATNQSAPDPEPEIKTASNSSRRHTHALSISFSRRKQKGKDVVVVPPPTTSEKSPRSGSESTSPTHRVRTWLRSHLPQQRAKSQGAVRETKSAAENKGFIGGAALAKLRGSNFSTPSIIESENRIQNRHNSTSTEGSLREVAMAGRKNGESSASATAAAAAAAAAGRHSMVLLPSPMTPSPVDGSPRSQSALERRSVSSISSDDGSADRFVEARSHLASPITPLTPPKVTGLSALAKSERSSPFRESRFSENLE
ncbi:hypothetical protein QBC42DRAFT_275816 [Cladorrhinum samala]|uniref:Eisosome protein 1 n=1 Tax=Cladorrhinum samala TaxID=585594 RepID=A0AAV9HCU2_9PEZI|nr:hypothetical protein QBC42DRAFT_275816 [Cladorrhinum samala]